MAGQGRKAKTQTFTFGPCGDQADALALTLRMVLIGRVLGICGDSKLRLRVHNPFGGLPCNPCFALGASREGVRRAD